MASVSFDPKAKTLYVKINNLRPAKTIPIGDGQQYMDISEVGKAVGLEIIFSKSIPKEAVDAIIELKDDEQIKLIQ
jgi:uncharacterized protein YuzE